MTLAAKTSPPSPLDWQERLRAYALLVRFHRPIGSLLLLWPALWALWLAGNGQPPWPVVLIFIAGVFLMRSAGCAINDFADRNLDGQVRRTRERPLATGLVSPREALGVFVALSLAAFLLVLLLDWRTVALSVVALGLAALYPFMKRFTHWPQVFLGAAFGWAVPMAYTAVTGQIPMEAWLLFLATLIWALIYDTQYSMVDRDDDLRLGLKCGGSDGFSGITANPLVGRVTDRCVSAGGTAILTEIPEAFGAERVLLERAVTRDVHDRLARILADFRQYFIDHGEPVHENPSPGNIEGGITTLEEKSLGAVQKGGRAPVTQVLRYAEGVRGEAGLAVLEAPGNDAVSSTALVAAGATVLLFTTGRGTPLGFPVPTLKIASNSDLARRKPAWIDFDAGPVVEGADPEQLATALFDLVLATASGRRARNEINDEREIAIWKQGVTL